MTKQLVDRGTTADDGSGDPLRTAFDKINDNADELFVRGNAFRFVSRTTTAEPGAPSDGDCYLLPTSGCTGSEWTGQDGKIGFYSDEQAAWVFITAAEGMLGWVADQNKAIIYNGSLWEQLFSGIAKVRCATTAAITLASDLENGDSIDSVTLALGDRVLVKDQASGAENGVYIVPASGAPTRATDADSSEELVNFACLVAEGSTNADKLFQCTTNAPITVDTTALTFTEFSSGGGSSIDQGTHTIPILAQAMTPNTTGGPAAGTTESTTNKVMLTTLDFDASSDESAQIVIPMDKKWDEGTVTVQFIWTAGATGDVVWGCQAVALSDDDAVDSAFGTAQTVTDSVTAAGDVMESAFTSAITIAGTPAAEDLVAFKFYRDADNGSDTLAADASLIAVRIKYTIDAADDS